MASLPQFKVLLPGLQVRSKEDLDLLGAPIFAEATSASLKSKTDVLSSLAEHFSHLPAHVSLVLLRSCFSMPKLTYLVRAAPTWLFPQDVISFDNTLKHTLEGILNVHLDEKQWCQASLPVRCGGLGIRRLMETGPIAFLASSHGVAELVARILPANGCGFRKLYVGEAFEAWSTLCPNSDRPENPANQRAWDDVLSRQYQSALLDEAAGADAARLRAVSRPESGLWLHALPSPHVGTLLDDDSLRVGAALRLGCVVCEPHLCVCGNMVEANEHHGLACVRCAGRIPRHQAINDIVRRALVSAGVPCVLEPPGLSRTDGKRPDGLTLIPWQRGRCLLWDVTCVSTYAASHLQGSVRAAGSAAEKAAGLKHAKYTDLELAYDFVPLAVETAGAWGSEAIKFVKEVGRRMRERRCDPRAGYFLAQQISLAIQRGNAAGIMGTFGREALRGGVFDDVLG
ncbi:hypothetical protein NE865_10937 [Phthorimaea operculella]|nr:hypothetical protein NE865_10937 [Phthorimaea operculella]